jgi:hypothetical protein
MRSPPGGKPATSSNHGGLKTSEVRTRHAHSPSQHTHRRLQFTILAYDAASGEIKTRSNGSLKECVGKLVDNEHILAADPLSRMIGTCVCGGVVYVT